MPTCENSHTCTEDYNCTYFPDKKDCPYKAPGYPQASSEAVSAELALLCCPGCEKLKAALSIAIQYLPTEGEEGYSEDVYKEVAEVHELIKQAT